MRKIAILTAFILSTGLCKAEQVSIKSPSGNVEVTVSDEGGKASYTVNLDGKPMLISSALGLNTSIGDLTKGLKITGNKTQEIQQSYDLRNFKASHIDYKANELTLTLENEQQIKMTVTFRVSDRDVAFRYGLPTQQKTNKQRALIYGEASSFNFPEGTTTFLSPQIGPETGWAQTKPSYEEVYTADAPMNTPSQYGHGYVFPCLFHLPDGWALISETGTTSGYCGTHLSDYDATNGYTIAFPDKGENNGFGSEFVTCSLPTETPWRTITVGTLNDMVETTVSTDVVASLYEASEEYKPGRYTWSWLIWQDRATNYNDQVKLIDVASEMGYEYYLVDALWDTQIGRDRMEELSRYARQKGVSLMLWYNSNGSWNDAKQSPRNCMNTALARNREMAWLQKIGVKGIKVDFFGGDKQETIQLYEDIMADANRYGIQVIFHGCTLPRGWERMFPNFVSSEAVLASENVYFTESAAIREAYDLTLHPFCRNAVASIDWGGVIMNRYMSRDNKSRHTRKTTDIFEMASGITNQTSIQCVALYPNNLKELPQMELDFLRQLPTTWDETRLIEGYPGRYVVLARRHNNNWYIAGLNAQAEPVKLTLNLPMLAGQTVDYYVDDKQGQPTLTSLKVDKKGRAKVTIQPNGGLIIK